MFKLKVGAVYKFHKTSANTLVVVFDENVFHYANEIFNVDTAVVYKNAKLLPRPLIFTVIDIGYTQNVFIGRKYFCYKLLIGDKIYTKFFLIEKKQYEDVAKIC